LNYSKEKNIPTGVAAFQLATDLQKELHPIWGHRSKYIIQSLIDTEWEKN
jgi:hypothetical protein